MHFFKPERIYLTVIERKNKLDLTRHLALLFDKKRRTESDNMIKRNLIKHNLFKIILLAAAFALSLVCELTFASAGATYVLTASKKRELPVYSVERTDKRVSISFDCAWGTEYTDEILDNLDRYGVKCTFFAVQFWVEKYPDYAKKIVERGHEIETHSATHSHMSKLSEEQIKNELIKSSQAIESATGQKVTLFRCPFGEYDDKVILTARSLGLQVVQWDVDSLDWKDLSAADIAARVTKRTESGSIILCHNNGLNTAKALPLIFTALQEKGYEFIPISQLIYNENYEIDANGRQIPI